jgi:MFS family permease
MNNMAAPDAHLRAPSSPEPAPPPGEPWPSPRQAWYAVALFAASLTINFLDRGIIFLLVEPIKKDLQLTDIQMSLLIGFAFVLFYVILGLPIARLVDRASRKLILGVGITVWSVMTAVCGLAQSYWQLFVGRVGVGVGEASSGPATYSMLADLFPPARLPRAISVLNFGFVAGNAMASLLGAAAIQMVSALPPLSVPVVGALRPWQLVFMMVSIPGFLVAALFTTLREPVRRGRVAVADGAVRSMPIRDVVGFMRANGRTYGPMFLGLAFNATMYFGIQSWAAAFFQRTYGWSPAHFGFVQGIVLLVVQPIGLMLGSALAERWARQGRTDANLRVTFLAFALASPAAALFPLMPTASLSMVVFAVLQFVAMLSPGPQNAALQIITPNQMRGQVTALYLFVFNIVGIGTGSTVLAFVTDHVFGNEAQLRYAMTTVAAIMGPISAAIIWSGLKPYVGSVLRSRSWA